MAGLKRSPDAVATRHAALRGALAVAARRVRQLHTNGDLAGMEEVFEGMGEMWGLKLLEDD